MRLNPVFIAIAIILTTTVALARTWPNWIDWLLGIAFLIAMTLSCRPEKSPHQRALRSIQSDEVTGSLRERHPAPFRRGA